MGKFVLEWENISVDAFEKGNTFFFAKSNKKTILKNESGAVYNYTLTAIMGPSGAGKTTLLGALSGRTKGIRGLLYINNVAMDSKAMAKYSSYLYQDCAFMECLTVTENFRFMIALKLNKQEKKTVYERYKKIMSDLNLFGCQSSALKVLSGGERKRVALAVELINDPDILFCDEPTTGLDSFNAQTVIEKLQSLAFSGKLVIVTIHQPSVQIFQYFTHLILLSNGTTVYHGRTEDGLFAIKRYIGELYCIRQNEINNLQNNKKEKTTGPYWPKKLNVNNGFFIEIIWLTYREYLNWKGGVIESLIQFLLLMVTALIVSVIYQGVFEVNVEQNVSGLLYFLTTELLFTHVYSVINTFPGNFCIFLREKDLYSTQSYFISKVVSMIPRTFLQPCCYFGLISLLVPFLPNITLYVKMLTVLFFGSFTASLLGMCVSANFSSVEYMDLFLVPFDTFSLIITGAALSIPYLPTYILWTKYLSPFSFTYESLNTLYWTSFGKQPVLNGTTASGFDVLKKQGYPTEEKRVIENILYLCLLSIGLGLLGFIGLINKKKKYNAH